MWKLCFEIQLSKRIEMAQNSRYSKKEIKNRKKDNVV